MKIYLATNNLNKRREMAALLAGYEVVIPADEGIDFDPIEDGKSFYENSLIKSRALFEIVHSPVIADDSGICVAALGGAPGIYSARYAGPNAMQGNGKKVKQEEQNRMLIEQLNGALNGSNGTSIPPVASLDLSTAQSSVAGCTSAAFPNGKRSAHYTCAMTFYFGRDRYTVAQETMEGAIVESISSARGKGGFGYDPIFFLPSLGKTAAELTAAEKNAISHRGKAARIIEAAVRALLG